MPAPRARRPVSRWTSPRNGTAKVRSTASPRGSSPRLNGNVAGRRHEAMAGRSQAKPQIGSLNDVAPLAVVLAGRGPTDYITGQVNRGGWAITTTRCGRPHEVSTSQFALALTAFVPPCRAEATRAVACPMHPEVRKAVNRSCPLCAGAELEDLETVE